MLNRLPKPQAILQVYAVIAVMLSAWTITAFLWKLSAWLLLLNLGEIFTIFSYAMFANLLESLVILSLLLLICVLLPAHTLRDNFVVGGTILSAGMVASLMVFVGLRMLFGTETRLALTIGPLTVMLLTLLLLRLASISRFRSSVSSVALWISDRLTVFLFILVPLFILLSAYVIFRNIT